VGSGTVMNYKLSVPCLEVIKDYPLFQSSRLDQLMLQ
jgi:hypothetical protein